MAEEPGLLLVEATGNRFGLVDGFRERSPADPALLAGELGARGLDGLLELLPPLSSLSLSTGGDARMILWNADGSRPEACGNGLRCVACLAVERGHVRGPRVRIETDSGVREVEVLEERGRAVAARAELGRPRIEGLDEPLLEDVVACLVRIGNPHCVVFVPDVDAAPVVRLGPVLEHHARFPDRTNVEFVEVGAGGRLRVRIWERGVGETRSCGTGVAAAAVAALARGFTRSPVDVETRGGQLRVAWDGAEVLLEGPVSRPRALPASSGVGA